MLNKRRRRKNSDKNTHRIDANIPPLLLNFTSLRTGGGIFGMNSSDMVIQEYRKRLQGPFFGILPKISVDVECASRPHPAGCCLVRGFYPKH